MSYRFIFYVSLVTLIRAEAINAQGINANNKPAQLDIREAGENSIRITLKPISFSEDFPATPSLSERKYTSPAISLRELDQSVKKKIGNLNVEIRHSPLTILVTTVNHKPVQKITFLNNGNLSFALSGQPILGLGEGGPKPDKGINWRALPVEFDRFGRLHNMQPRWQADAYGSRNPVALIIGTEGWAIFIATPWGQIDLTNKDHGIFIPRLQPETSDPQTETNQNLNLGKGLPPSDKIISGLYDFFVFDAHDPTQLMKDIATISGPAVLPPKWSMGYMQSHRTLKDETQMINIVDTFRSKQIPLDAVIYLGTGFCPSGWNTKQPSFEFNTEVFKRAPKDVLSDLHHRNVKVVVHIVPWDRDRLPTLHGSIPPQPGEILNASHIVNYWNQHTELVHAGVDAFWPDEGDWFDLFERIKRHQLYYQGPLSTMSNLRPWSLHRNGHLGIAQWGGWVWSGDTESSWKTLEAQIAVGINHSLSVSPFWGSDIGGFYPNPEKTGELYARWFQFGAFCPSFRSHGRTWQTCLPWGWGLPDMGIQEGNNVNSGNFPERNPLPSEMNNSAIEPVCKKYAELRYQLLPYNYTLAWEARTTGMPMMRSLWLHYPDTKISRSLGNEYLWGRDLLIAPVFTKSAGTRSLYLPQGVWYDWWTLAKLTGGKNIVRKVDLATLPIFVRAGAIIPFDPVRQYTSQVLTEPTTLKVFQGADGTFTWYEDDGNSLDYLTGKATLTHISWNDETKKLTLVSEGSMEWVKKNLLIELLPSGTTKKITYSGRPTEVTF